MEDQDFKIQREERFEIIGGGEETTNYNYVGPPQEVVEQSHHHQRSSSHPRHGEYNSLQNEEEVQPQTTSNAHHQRTSSSSSFQSSHHQYSPLRIDQEQPAIQVHIENNYQPNESYPTNPNQDQQYLAPSPPHHHHLHHQNHYLIPQQQQQENEQNENIGNNNYEGGENNENHHHHNNDENNNNNNNNNLNHENDQNEEEDAVEEEEYVMSREEEEELEDDDIIGSEEIEEAKKAMQVNPKFHEQRLFVPYVLGGFALSLNAGYLNACFLFGEYSQPVGHVTGTITKVAHYVALTQFEEAGYATSIIVSFFFGAFLAGLMIKKTVFKLRPRYGFALMFEAILLLASSLIIELFDSRTRWSDVLAAIACGLQNSMVSSFSQAVVRTTHMTGIVTDIGHICGALIRTWDFAESEAWKLKVLVPLLLGYTAGGFMGSFIPQEMAWSYSTLPSSLFCFVCASIYLFYRFVRKILFWVKMCRSTTEVLGNPNDPLPSPPSESSPSSAVSSEISREEINT